MKHLLDVNVFLAISIESHVHQQSATSWWNTVQRPDELLFCSATRLSFLRLLTTATVFRGLSRPPLGNHEAWSVLDALLADARVGCVTIEPPGLESVFRVFAGRPSSSPNLWMDAYLAAFASAGGYRFVTFDQAFRQFDGLDLLLLE